MSRFAVLLTSQVAVTGLVAQPADFTVGLGVRVVANAPANPLPYDYEGHGLSAWSPGGQHLAYAAPSGGLYAPLMLLEMAAPAEPRALTTQPGFDPTWHPSGESLAFVGQRPGRDGPVTTLYRQSFLGGDPEDLLLGDEPTRGIKAVGEIQRGNLGSRRHLAWAALGRRWVAAGAGEQPVRNVRTGCVHEESV